MPRDILSDSVEAEVGPNAILQMLPVLDEEIGRSARIDWMHRIGVEVPRGDEMVPEVAALLLHGVVRDRFGPRAPGILARAGRRTGAYILANRIPPLAKLVLRRLPAGLAARLLSKAIGRHAWTFAGSGQFKVLTPWTFEIAQNPGARRERSMFPVCYWHAAVFETLYRALVHPGARCREVGCGAQGVIACRFTIET